MIGFPSVALSSGGILPPGDVRAGYTYSPSIFDTMRHVFGTRRSVDLDDSRVVELFDQHYRALTRAAYLLLRDSHAAEETVQEAFTRLLASRSKLNDLDNAPAYLRSIVFNLARAHMRRRSTARSHEDFIRLAALNAERAQNDCLPELEAERSSSSTELMVALAALSERQRECLVMRYFLEMDEAEIAAALRISRGSVKTHTSRGLQAMRNPSGDRK